jgi:cyclopropane-fatty-acyl-phospholipid synthase
MLYKFKSKATGDVIMLEPQGRQILQIMGKDPGLKGIILAAEMPAAIGALQAAVVQEEHDIEAATKLQQGEGSVSAPTGGARGIRLKQRVVPIIDMLKRAHAEEVDVVWGV